VPAARNRELSPFFRSELCALLCRWCSVLERDVVDFERLIAVRADGAGDADAAEVDDEKARLGCGCKPDCSRSLLSSCFWAFAFLTATVARDFSRSRSSFCWTIFLCCTATASCKAMTARGWPANAAAVRGLSASPRAVGRLSVVSRMRSRRLESQQRQARRNCNSDTHRDTGSPGVQVL
jgi:hypothetical protein